MSEICFDFFNEIMEGNDKESNYILSDELYICEECGEFKHVIVVAKRSYYKRKFRYLLFPFLLVYKTLYVLWRIVLLPYLIYQQRKASKR